jgi:hypothetical protein
MSQLTRSYNFQEGQRIQSAQVDEELDQLVAGHNEHDTRIDTVETSVEVMQGALQAAVDGIVPPSTITAAMIQDGAIAHNELSASEQTASVGGMLNAYYNQGGW